MNRLPVAEGETKLQTVRLFFALWPDASVRCALDQLGKQMHEQCGGRRTHADAIHITLAFLGEVAVTRIAELQVLAAQLQGDAFDFELSHLGWWRQNHIAWVAPQTVPQALTRLVSELQNQLQRAGFEVDTRAYLPHVTLLRKADCPRPLPEIAAITWTVRDFVLVQSVMTEHGSAYEIIGRWSLTYR